MATAHVRVINCSAEHQRVNVTVDGTSEGSVDYRDQTDYVAVDTGTTDVAVSPSEGGPEVRDTFDLEEDDVRTVVVVGGDEEPLAIVLMEDDPGPVDAGESHVRFFNGVPHSTPLEVTFGDAVVDHDDEVLSKDIAYGQHGSYRPVAAGSHEVELHVDPHEWGAEDSLVHTERVTFEGGRAHTMIAITGRGGDDFDLITFEDVPLAPPQS